MSRPKPIRTLLGWHGFDGENQGGSMTAQIARRMAEAAKMLVESLDSSQRSILCRPFPDEEERRMWFYTPTDHGGLPLSAMNATQHQNVHRLVSTGLSNAGYVTAATIIGLENILDRVDDFSAKLGRERGRDPLLYYTTIFGDPGSDNLWGWRFGGHHISLHFMIAGGEVVASTPNFLGADPADAPLLGPHLHRPLAAIEDLGRELFHTFDADKRSKALLSSVTPYDIVSGNRSRVGSGDYTKPMLDIMRGQPEGAYRDLLIELQAKFDAALKLSAREREALTLTSIPKGIPSTALSDGEAELLRELINCYVNRLPDSLADRQAAFVEQEFEKLSFAWAGSGNKGEAHYYRIQGERLFIEYDNTQRGGNHIHAVWRDTSRHAAAT